MKIIILGSEGMLGHDLKRVFKKKNIKFTAPTREDLDITQEQSIYEYINDIKAEVLIHSAAFTEVDRCEEKKDYAYLVNGFSTKSIAHACLSAGTKIVYISTDYVFDGEKKTAYSEDDKPNPLNIYGSSKHKGEVFIQNSGANHLIIRTSWLYGEYGKNFITTILKMAQLRPDLTIVSDQIGSPTYTQDLASGILNLLNKNAQGVYHIANSGSCSWFFFAEKIFTLAGIKHTHLTPISSELFNRPAKRPKNSVLDCCKYSRLTGSPLRPWDCALKEYMSKSNLLSPVCL